MWFIHDPELANLGSIAKYAKRYDVVLSMAFPSKETIPTFLPTL